MERAVKWYYKRIHACDLNGWERSVERNEQTTSFTHIPHHHHMRGKRDQHQQEYVDIDVVRGSAWSKSKARQGAVMVLMDGLARIIMFPFFITWWVDQLTLTSALFFSLLHVAMATTLACYLLNPGEFAEVPAGEVAVPYALMIVVGSIHCQIVSTTTTTSHDVMGWMGEEVRMEGDKQDTSVDDDDDIIPSLSSEDTINVRVWEGGRCVKMPLNFVQIGAAIMRKAYFSNARGHLEGAKTSVLGATCAVPFLHRLHRHRGTLSKMDAAYRLMYGGGGKWFVRATVGVSFVSRAILTMSLAVMLVTTDRTFRKRLRHAKHFSHLTSVRRAAKSGLPHFRLSKMARVKAWLSLRSYLQRRGPQRSTDIVLSAAYTAFMLLLCFSTVKIMGSCSFHDSLLMWECLAWQVSLGLFLLGYVFTGAQIHRKYAANCSILLTEQFNVFMQMENFPEKKEKLQRVNNALTVTSKLIKESRASSSIFGGGGGGGGGLTKNPLFYNLLKVLVLSAVSGAVSEVLGFKVKVWKIKD